MKVSLQDFGWKPAWPSVILLGCVLVAAANGPTASSAGRAHGSAAPSSNKGPGQPEIPKSVFVVPSEASEGRDPFFPNSTRLFGSKAPKPIPANIPVEVNLKGFSGPPEKRLAIINNKTFAEGEETDVITAKGRVHLRCLQIKTDSVVIQIGTETRELRLRSGL